MPNKKPSYRYLIALGSSLGDKKQNILDCIAAIEANLGPVTARSSLVSTEPFGGEATEDFINAAIVVHSDAEPASCITKLLEIEEELGRIRAVRWSDRTIDADIILIEKDSISLEINTKRLRVPHPECQKRAFVLDPCSEIAGDWLHPERKKTIKELSDELSSQSN